MRRILALTLTLARFITTKWSGVSECYLKDSCPSDALRAMPTCKLEAPSCWCHSPPPWPPGADSPGAWLQNGTRVSGWAAQGPMGGGTAAVRYGGSRLLCGLQHPGRELSPGRTRECVTPRRSSRRKIGRTAETTPRAHRVLCGHVRAPRPDSDVRSSLAYRRESYRAALVLQAWIGSRVRSVYTYLINYRHMILSKVGLF